MLRIVSSNRDQAALARPALALAGCEPGHERFELRYSILRPDAQASGRVAIGRYIHRHASFSRVVQCASRQPPASQTGDADRRSSENKRTHVGPRLGVGRKIDPGRAREPRSRLKFASGRPSAPSIRRALRPGKRVDVVLHAIGHWSILRRFRGRLCRPWSCGRSSASARMACGFSSRPCARRQCACRRCASGEGTSVQLRTIEVLSKGSRGCVAEREPRDRRSADFASGTRTPDVSASRKDDISS